ncbi:hypothetical protein V6N11_023686 [Hibiscus sabdariffa]|uniref:Uncharacterized protein n=1 Tax=Hibiscus sabdariffa TaxID=183260 RepID=A0ABR2TN69_9ROSI
MAERSIPCRGSRGFVVNSSSRIQGQGSLHHFHERQRLPGSSLWVSFDGTCRESVSTIKASLKATISLSCHPLLRK